MSRLDRVNELVKQEVAFILQMIVKDKYLGMLTVTNVETSPDLNYANVWISTMNRLDEREVNKILKGYLYDIQGELNNRLHLKFVPRIRFKVDYSSEHVEKVENILKSLKK